MSDEKLVKIKTNKNGSGIKIFSLFRFFYFCKEEKIEYNTLKNKKMLVVGIAGGTGSGKTTVTEILKIIPKKFFKRKVHVSSIDDFYKTLNDRDKMSHKIHPLFKIRGVPGTHDINLVKKFFNKVKTKNKFNIYNFN